MMLYLARLFYPLSILFYILAASSLCLAQKTTNDIIWNFKNVDIVTLIHTVSEMTGKNFVIDPKVKGEVTFVSNQALNKAAAYETFLSILQVNGFTAIDTGKNNPIKIVPTVDALEMIYVEHAAAGDLVETLAKLLRQKAATGIPAQDLHLAADTRTNSILISGGSLQQRSYLKKMVAQLDVATNNHFNSEVIYLKYIKGKDIAPIVATFLEEALKKEGCSAGLEPMRPFSAAATTAFASQGTGERGLSHRGYREEYSGVQGTLFQSNENQPKSGVINNLLQWEETSNALIVKAPPMTMRAVKNIIAKLDIRRPQILIEVIIAEVSLSRGHELGVEFGSVNDPVSVATRFPFNLGGTNGGTLIGDFAKSTLPIPGGLGTGLSVGIFSNGNLRALLRALDSDSATHILSTPSLMTLDNQAALIKVGSKVSFAIGTNETQVTGGGTPFTSFNREEVGLSLAIKPQITHSGAVKLEIENIISNITGTTGAGDNPTTAERSIVTNVMIDDGKILVLGGLIQEQWSEKINKVPVLGDIPLLGKLFQNHTKTLEKTNLMVFIRPVIIRDDQQGIIVSNCKYDELRDYQIRSQDEFQRPFIDEPPRLAPLSKIDYSTKQMSPSCQRCDGVKGGRLLPAPFDECMDNCATS